jgi:hypothetical protein
MWGPWKKEQEPDGRGNHKKMFLANVEHVIQRL